MIGNERAHRSLLKHTKFSTKMPPKARKQSQNDFKQEDILQAVVIVDSFNVRFAPVTKTKPRALLPLVNLPLIDYTLEFLEAAGIQHVIIFCCIHADQIRQHIDQSRWQSSQSSLEIDIIVSEDCRSVGDALRDIDAKSLIQNDFVLVNGDVVSNVNLKPIIQVHKERRIKEKTCVMTLLYREAPPSHPTRSVEEDVLLAVDKGHRIISYQKVMDINRFTLPLDIFQDKSYVELRFDLQDCHISICSPSVPSLFTDNFDFLSRDQFVKGILVNEDILGSTIHLHVLKDEYACRVSNLQMYDAISQDVLSRCVYPFVPDRWTDNGENDKYTHGRHNIYRHKDVTLARGCILEENVIIGKGSTVGSNTKISYSVMGKNVKIGENVTIEGAYIWDDCVIGNDCVLTQCLLDNGVCLKSGVEVKPGCVLAKNVTIGPSVTLENVSLWTTEPGGRSVDRAQVGSEGNALPFVHEADSDDEDELTTALPQWGAEPVEGEEEDEENESSEASSDDESRPSSPELDEAQMFYDEAIITLDRAIAENINTENIILELNSLKSAYGIYINEVNTLVTRAILELPVSKNNDLEPTEYVAQFKKNFVKIHPVLTNYVRSSESETDCIYSIEETSLNNEVVKSCLVKVLHFLYDSDILSEEVILSWHKTTKSTERVQERKEIRQKVSSLIQWLEQAEEESDED